MTITWLALVGGLLLGLVPPRWLINTEVRYLRFDSIWHRIAGPQRAGQRRRRWWKFALLWIDPLRGYVVADLLCESFRASPGSSGLHAHLATVATLACLFAVVIAQTGGRTAFGETLAPCGFLAGAMLAVVPWIVALAAIALGAANTVAIKRFTAGFVTSACATAGIGYLFLGRSIWLVACTLLVSVPLLISWFRRRSLVMPFRT